MSGYICRCVCTKYLFVLEWFGSDCYARHIYTLLVSRWYSQGLREGGRKGERERGREGGGDRWEKEGARKRRRDGGRVRDREGRKRWREG